jgi:hypothetical protein
MTQKSKKSLPLGKDEEMKTLIKAEEQKTGV